MILNNISLVRFRNLLKSDKIQILVRNRSKQKSYLSNYLKSINIHYSTRKSILNFIKMQQINIPKHKIVVRPPILKPKITNIGYGNPRYNSMIPYKNDTLLIPVGSSLRVVNLKNNQILYCKQIGHSQIFQISQNSKYILVVNFEGLVTFLDKQNLQIKYQLHAPGKQIRHLSFNDYRLAISCQLSELEHIAKFCIYKMSQIQKGIKQPAFMKTGHYYFPQELENNNLIVIQYQDPNPKGRSRTQTVMLEKKPIKHRILRFIQHQKQLKQQQLFEIKQKGQIICATSNEDTVFYLHPGRKITVFCNSNNTSIQMPLPGKSIPIMIQKYKKGFIWSSASNQLTYAFLDKQKSQLVFSQIKISSQGVGGNLSIKPIKEDQGFFLFNQKGIHHYCRKTDKTFSQSQFQITNCGLSMNEDGSLVAVGDFAGNISILQTHPQNITPKALKKTNVGMPIRALVWCHKKNIIVIGCVGGGIFAWNINDPQPILLDQIDHSVNIIRYAHQKVFLGTSDGQVKILNQQTLALLYEFKAHHPINYQTEEQRELFGSMKNYAQIWSLTISPYADQKSYTIISSSEDQTEKIFTIKQHKEHEQIHHLKGHQLAVTSIDWKIMGKDLGQIYVSCSDDKRVRFRNPKKGFQILFQLQTNTIKQWHTLTYLALQENGTKVAIGSQNGYLFIFDLESKQLLFGEKIHLGGVEGLDWRNNKLITCSSDLCISVLDFS